MTTINTNLSSLNAQRNLTKSAGELSTSMQRLSSGLRVNSAKDDAAGMSIATKMDSQMRGMTQASRNANDGISLIQTADGALSNIGDALQRIRELAVQGANATNGTDEWKNIDTEMQELNKEIARIAKDTKFNGNAVLSSTAATKNIQVGADSGQTITVSFGANTAFAGLTIAVDDRRNDLVDRPGRSRRRPDRPEHRARIAGYRTEPHGLRHQQPGYLDREPVGSKEPHHGHRLRC